MAIIFFISDSVRAIAPAIAAVARPIAAVIHLIPVVWLTNRIIRRTPAVTSVDECTSAEIGVGAAMAAGNHAEKGICALFVILLRKIRKILVFFIVESWNQEGSDRNENKHAMRNISPIRFEKIVVRLAPIVGLFW